MTIGNQNAEQVPDMREYSESMRSHAGIVIICKVKETLHDMCIGADECDPDFCNILMICCMLFMVIGCEKYMFV